ncbi:MAG: hypothetical protein ACFCBW_03010 [Candidatus Competibacterales bacterium]
MNFAKALGATALIVLLPWSQHGQGAEPLRFDFVNDRPFPAEAERQREFGESLTFTNSDIVVTVTGENEFGSAVEVSRRGPGGLGVRGNGDRNAAGEGTTSGNRVNNGEHLILSFTDGYGAPLEVVLESIVFDRVVRDTEHFADAGPTRYRLLANGESLQSGELQAEAGAVTVNFDGAKASAEFRITNDEPFHPIANRFRVAAMTVSVAE